MSSQSKYRKSEKGKAAQKKAQEKYDNENSEKRREQKREYMRRKRAENPNYCKWKWVNKIAKQENVILINLPGTGREMPREIITQSNSKRITTKLIGLKRKNRYSFFTS